MCNLCDVDEFDDGKRPKYKEKYLRLSRQHDSLHAEYNQLLSDLKTIHTYTFHEMQEIQAKGVQFGRSLYANELEKVIKENLELKQKLNLIVPLEDRKVSQEIKK